MPGTKVSPQKLCMDLLRANAEGEVVAILKEAGYWDDQNVWRPFGDKEDNYSTIGNQARTPEGALVEKLVNSVDAVLMGECLSRGIRPNSKQAPPTIKDAVALYFGDGSRPETQGDISSWPDKKLRSVSNLITLATTGTRQNPSITVVDAGEGQHPEDLPDTILSLDKQNKIDIHFVQGTFNMGGTAALRFCGEQNLQLVISKRNPKIRDVRDKIPSEDQWGFTIIRRENPSSSRKMSTYKFLAPERNGVLRFRAGSLPLFPEFNRAYARMTSWGTAIKLYEYKLDGRSHILLRGGLLRRLDILLPSIGLPVRLHECRSFKGRSASFDNSLTGLRVRLSGERNLERGFPKSGSMVISEQRMSIEIYAFKKGRAATYMKPSEGIIFAVNGQTQGKLHRRFFGRRSVGMDRIQDSILVVVDCSLIDGRHREDLFINDRDGMAEGPFLKEIERELEQFLRGHQGLKELREKRHSDDIASKLEDSKPFKELLGEVIRKFPVLTSLFGDGGTLPDPVRPKPKKEFTGKTHPTIFHFRNKKQGEKLHRTTPLNMRSRIIFQTDVVDDYFTRSKYPGKFTLHRLNGSRKNGAPPKHGLNLDCGAATLNLALPLHPKVGDTYEYELRVGDATLLKPFVNSFSVSVGPMQKQRPRPPVPPPSLAVPNAIQVYESNWIDYEFDEFSALKAIYDPSSDGSTGQYTYYINMDNFFLRAELKSTKASVEILKAKWLYAMALIAMALLREDKPNSSSNRNGSKEQSHDGDLSPEEKASEAAKAIAPVLLPMIEHLGGLSDKVIS